jgi:large subunit ribosomal protein L5
MNVMQQPRIEKLTLNIGAGTDQNKLDKAITVLKTLSGVEPVKTVSKKRNPTWGLRPGLPIGCMLTLRKDTAATMLKRLLRAKDFTLKATNFDANGNLSFGVLEHTEVEGVAYDPKIGVLGLQACITLEKPGYRVKKRSIRKNAVGKKHKLTKEEAIEYIKANFGVKIQGDEQ